MMNIILTTYLVGLIFFIFLWLVSLYTKKSSVIDIGWGFHFSIISIFYTTYYSLNLSLKHGIILFLILAWSCRLGCYLLIRYIHENKEDKRYEKIKKEWSATNISFIKMFVFQSFIASSLSFPFYYLLSNPISNDLLFSLGSSLMLLSLVLESVADFQLFKFKKDKNNKGKVCNRGLWAFSRHPNYFFEWMVWVSISIISMSIDLKGAFSLYAVVFMYTTLNHISGIPFLEEDARNGIFKKEGEEEYFKNTPAFFIDLKKLI